MKPILAVFAVLVFAVTCLACPPPASPGYEGPPCANGPVPAGDMPDSCPMPQSCEGQKGWVQPDDTQNPPPQQSNQFEEVEFSEVTV